MLEKLLLSRVSNTIDANGTYALTFYAEGDNWFNAVPVSKIGFPIYTIDSPIETAEEYKQIVETCSVIYDMKQDLDNLKKLKSDFGQGNESSRASLIIPGYFGNNNYNMILFPVFNEYTFNRYCEINTSLPYSKTVGGLRLLDVDPFKWDVNDTFGFAFIFQLKASTQVEITITMTV